MPFIARYRKEVTELLDDAQLRTLEERLRYLRELEERRAAILESIRGQGKLDDALAGPDAGGRHQGPARGHLPAVQAEAAHQGADRPGGRAGAAGRRAARRPDAGPAGRRRPAFVERRARAWPTPPAALEGARAILVERFAEDADLVGELRERMWSRGPVTAKVRAGQGGGGRQVRRLLRLRRAVHEAALAPHPGHVPRREGGGPRPHHGARGAGSARRGAARSGRPTTSGRIAHAVRQSPTGAARPTAGCSTRSAGPGGPGSARPPRHRPADAAVPGGRGRGGAGLRDQPARPAAGRAGRHAAPRWASTPASAPA